MAPVHELYRELICFFFFKCFFFFYLIVLLLIHRFTVLHVCYITQAFHQIIWKLLIVAFVIFFGKVFDMFVHSYHDSEKWFLSMWCRTMLNEYMKYLWGQYKTVCGIKFFFDYARRSRSKLIVIAEWFLNHQYFERIYSII